MMAEEGLFSANQDYLPLPRPASGVSSSPNLYATFVYRAALMDAPTGQAIFHSHPPNHWFASHA